MKASTEAAEKQREAGTLLAFFLLMTKTFVVLNDPVHSLIRNVTRHTPLRVGLSRDERLMVQYSFQKYDLPEAYYSLAAFHSLGGMSLKVLRLRKWRVTQSQKPSIPARVNYFDAVRLDRRCGRDLRLKMKRHGPGLLAGELLCFGTGVLRARNDDPLERVYQYLRRRYGRLHTRHELVFARIRALHWNSLPLLYQKQKESFDSTNLIYGDTFGELEQLWERRADTVFLDQVAHALQRMRSQAEIAAFLHPPLNLEAVMRLHLRCQAIWKSPPSSARALLRRLEFIFGNTVVDIAPTSVFHTPDPGPEAETRFGAGRGREWHADRSGYDGWLAGNGDAAWGDAC